MPQPRNLYQANLRQSTPTGTLRAFADTHLDRLAALHIDGLWLMPIHPIGEANRKGTLGSYYAVRDYYAVNPELGTADDLRYLIEQAHARRISVYLDWVAGHTSTDAVLLHDHPEWYARDADGRLRSTPWRDYDDIVNLDYRHRGLRDYMIHAMTYWVREFDVDGFRCDLASFVPLGFWQEARRALDRVKPVFMLAEGADRDLHDRAFDCTYSWEFWNKLHAIAVLNGPVAGLTEGYLAEQAGTWPRHGSRLHFIDNHDKNSWEGNQITNFGAALPAAIVLSCTLEGIPLLYSGQEAGLDRSLAFFDRDPISWQDHSLGDLYGSLFALRTRVRALWPGRAGAPVERIRHDREGQVVAFRRGGVEAAVVVVVNLSNQQAEVTLEQVCGTYSELFSQVTSELGERTISLAAWEYRVFERAAG